MAAFTWTVDFGISGNTRPNVKQVKMGDGYEQRIPVGINTLQKTWSVKFENRTDAETAEIIAFLEARAGVEAFDWTPPGRSQAKFVCREWSDTRVRANLNSISCAFEMVYEP